MLPSSLNVNAATVNVIKTKEVFNVSRSYGSTPKEVAALRIIIPVLLVIVIAGIWAMKNSQKIGDSNNTTTIAQTDAEGETIAGSNPDFDLNVSGSLDFVKLKTYNLPILVEFGAEWCAPCRQMLPIITGLNEELKGKAIVKFVDIDKNASIAADYNFQYIPTQLFINADGTPYNPANAAAMQMDLKYDPGTNELMYTTHTGTLTKEELSSILAEMGMK